MSSTLIPMSPFVDEMIDPPILSLVHALNRLPGIVTCGSCGGHAQPNEIQQPAGKWFVSFNVEFTDTGWRSLKFLGWVVGMKWAIWQVRLEPNYDFYAPSRFGAGRTGWALTGEQLQPEMMGAWLDKFRLNHFEVDDSEVVGQELEGVA